MYVTYEILIILALYRNCLHPVSNNAPPRDQTGITHFSIMWQGIPDIAHSKHKRDQLHLLCRTSDIYNTTMPSFSARPWKEWLHIQVTTSVNLTDLIHLLENTLFLCQAYSTSPSRLSQGMLLIFIMEKTESLEFYNRRCMWYPVRNCQNSVIALTRINSRQDKGNLLNG